MTPILVPRLLLVLLGALLLASCASSPAPPVPDFAPVGEGLKVIGYALVAAAVLFVLSKFIH